jgi:ankyrin repeat protein
MTNINAEALYKACVSGDAAAVSRLLPAGGTPRNLSGQRFQFHTSKNTPLIAAAEGGHTEIMRMLLDRARNTIVDYANVYGFTAQLVAVLYHHADILGLLADRGANVKLATHEGDTALRIAVGTIHPDDRPRDPDPDGARQVATVKALLQLGAGTLPARAPRSALLT